ncbi:MAG: hypothetical protein AUK47_06530 [Deltaproteobacteria bacterium CG2_30_63_29]|nr:MAG: hypothetical protein AUK47_06530 [Deltaproteobacteria bacterium CG2_30_63_29]
MTKTLFQLVFIGLLVASFAACQGPTDSKSKAPSKTEVESGSRSSAAAKRRAQDETPPVLTVSAKRLDTVRQPADVDETGLVYQVRPSAPVPQTQTNVLAVRSSPLTDAEVKAVWSRVESLPEAEKKPQALSPSPLPIPQASERRAVFPAAAAPAPPGVTAAETLTVIRYAPEGEVEVVPFVSVTFSQPVIALGTVEQVDDAEVLATITPAVEGRWRWLGTQTLLFEPTTRMPKSTHFEVTVKAGLTSSLGNRLHNDAVFSFDTSRLQLVRHFPSSSATPQPRDVVFFAEFDQAIDPAAVFPFIELVDGQDEVRKVQRVDVETLPPNDPVRSLSSAAKVDRWIAFKAVDTLPPGNVEVRFRDGTPSAEGPRGSDAMQPFDVTIHGDLEALPGTCGNDGQCSPSSQVRLPFTNPLDEGKFQQGWVTIDPPVPHSQIGASGDFIWVTGSFQAEQTTTIRVDERLCDQFGQHQATASTFSFTPQVQPHVPWPMLLSNTREFTVLEASGKLEAELLVQDLESFDVALYAVDESQLPTYRHARHSETYRPSAAPVWSQTVHVENPQVRREHPIDLSPALRGGVGHVLLVATAEAAGKDQRLEVATWFQVTHLGLTVFADDVSTRVFVTQLETGKPLPGVSLWTEAEPGTSVRTDSSGLAQLPLPKLSDLLFARLGEDWAVVQEPGRGQASHPELAWYVVDDRRLYQPAETVHVKGWVRTIDTRLGGGVALGKLGNTLKYQVSSPSHVVVEGEAPVGSEGDFSFPFELPSDIDLGVVEVELSLTVPSSVRGEAYTHRIAVQEFKRPEFEASVEFDPGVQLLGEAAGVTTHVKYYAGGGLPDAKVMWDFTSQPASYSPPGHEGFGFGGWAPAWATGAVSPSADRYFETLRSSQVADRADLKVKLKPGRPEVVGGLDKRLVRKVINQNKRQVKACYQRELKKVGTSRMQGELVVKFQIDNEGQVSDAQVESDTTGNVAVGACLSQAIHSWRFPKPNTVGGVSVSYPFIFETETDALGDSEDSDEPHDLVGITDAHGAHRVELDWLSMAPRRPYVVTANVTIQDLNRRTMSSSAQTLVHPAAHYVGLKPHRFFVQPGEPLELDAIVSDIDGALLEGQLFTVRLVRGERVWSDTLLDWEVVMRDPQLCEALSSSQGAVRCQFEATTGGRYYAEASTKDAKGREHTSTLEVWVSEAPQRGSQRVERESVELIAERDRYLPGDTAQLLVQAPFGPASGLLLVERSGIVSTTRFELEGTSTILELPIDESLVPGFTAQVYLLGAAPRLDASGQPDTKRPTRPAYASGALELSVPPDAHRLLVTTTHPGVVTPGGKTEVDVEVVDWEGKPIEDAQVTLIVVDEAILALTAYEHPDPLEPFYPWRPTGTKDTDSRALLQLEEASRLETVEGSSSGSSAGNYGLALPSDTGGGSNQGGFGIGRFGTTGRGGGGAYGTNPEGEGPPPIAARSDFEPLAAFLPDLRTDDEGQLTATVSLPDNLTRYRVVALVQQEENFGKGESTLEARRDLMVRPSAPRFLSFGDQFELSVIVQNLSAQEQRVDLVAAVSNLKMEGNGGYRFLVPAERRVELRIPMSALETGEAVMQLVATAGELEDAVTLTIPVWAPATQEAFATYGQLDGDVAVQPIVKPQAVNPGVGALKITTSATPLQDLTDAFFYLFEYRYDGSEQLASKLLAIATLWKVLGELAPDGLPSSEALMESMEHDFELLNERRSLGGFGVWQAESPDPYVTLHVAHAIARAPGVAAAKSMEKETLAILRQIDTFIPEDWDGLQRRSAEAYALYVRQLMGDNVVAEARYLLGDAAMSDFTLDSLGWLASVMGQDPDSVAEREAIHKVFLSRVTETAGSAHFVTNYLDDELLLLSSDRRTDAIVLESLLRSNPDSDLIPKLADGLLAGREQGRWRTTQENVFVLLALEAYFDAYEQTPPDFLARTWLGDEFGGEQEYKGRAAAANVLEVPMAELLAQKGEEVPLTLGREGAGRLYYRIGLEYAPSDLTLVPEDRGFVVQRVYEAVDASDDVRRDDAGVWHIKAGALVRVRLTLVAEARRNYVALVDPLPAGLEPVNLSLIGSRPGGGSSTSGSRWARTWYDHVNARDERVEVFARRLSAQVYSYSYTAEASTIGTFTAAPARAEEMYQPETFGRGKSETVIVE